MQLIFHPKVQNPFHFTKSCSDPASTNLSLESLHLQHSPSVIRVSKNLFRTYYVPDPVQSILPILMVWLLPSTQYSEHIPNLILNVWTWETESCDWTTVPPLVNGQGKEWSQAVSSSGSWALNPSVKLLNANTDSSKDCIQLGHLRGLKWPGNCQLYTPHWPQRLEL